MVAAWSSGDSGSCPEKSKCSEEQTTEAEDQCGNIMTLEALADCRKVLNPLPFYEACKADFCVGGEEEVCKSVGSFVMECKHLGINVNKDGGWRNADFCRELFQKSHLE